MNRIILSRKGFDSSSGGAASPILDDGGKDVQYHPCQCHIGTEEPISQVFDFVFEVSKDFEFSNILSIFFNNFIP